MKKHEALKKLAPDDHIGRKLLSIYDEEVPDFVVQGLKDEHERAHTLKPLIIYCSLDVYKEFKKALKNR